MVVQDRGTVFDERGTPQGSGADRDFGSAEGAAGLALLLLVVPLRLLVIDLLVRDLFVRSL